ncbi:hypothetical protein SHIRM173S_05750 [Streptomyces hirsutus]
MRPTAPYPGITPSSWPGTGSPSSGCHRSGHLDAGFDQLEAGEEAGELLAGAQGQRDARGLELLGGRLRFLGSEVGRRVGNHQVAAGGQIGEQPADQLVGAVLVGDEVQQRDEGERDRPVEVEDLLRALQDALRIAHIGLEVLGHPLVGAAQQRARVGQHDRVVVAVDDARVGCDLLGDLVEVRFGGDAGADVEELLYALAGEPARGALHEGPVHPRHHGHPRVEGEHLPAHGLVDGVVVLAAEVPVVHPRGVRLARVDLDGVLLPGHDELRKCLQLLVINFSAEPVWWAGRAGTPGTECCAGDGGAYSAGSQQGEGGRRGRRAGGGTSNIGCTPGSNGRTVGKGQDSRKSASPALAPSMKAVISAEV